MGRPISLGTKEVDILSLVSKFAKSPSVKKDKVFFLDDERTFIFVEQKICGIGPTSSFSKQFNLHRVVGRRRR
jgi:hypothetical protein